MGKSSKKSASKVEAVVPAAKALKNGNKREAEESPVDFVSAKKQKSNEGVKQAIVIEKVEKKTRKKKQESSSSEEESSEEEEEVKPAKLNEKQAPKFVETAKVVAAPKKMAVDESDDDSSDDSDEESGSEEDSEYVKKTKTPKKSVANTVMSHAVQLYAVPQTKQSDSKKTPNTPGPKTLILGNLPFDIEPADVATFFQHCGEVDDVSSLNKKGTVQVEFATATAAQKARSLFSTKTPKVAAVSRKPVTKQSNWKKTPNTPATPETARSRTLFFGNLSVHTEPADVANEHERHRGFGHVEFATVEAAQKAIKLNGEKLCDKDIRLDFSREESSRPVCGRADEDYSFQRVRRIETSHGEADIVNQLTEYFGKCGPFATLSLPAVKPRNLRQHLISIDYLSGMGND